MKDFCPKGTHKTRNLPAPIEEGREVFFCYRAYDYIMHEVTPSVVPMAVRIAISV